MRPIALSGFMAAGKSTVGERLARSMGRSFVDLDSELEAAFALGISAIFETHGEPAFRRMEHRLLKQALSRSDRVVALGGGAILDPASRKLLVEQAHWIHLDVPLAELKRRVSSRGAEARPLWNDGELEALYGERLPLYKEAPLQIDGDRPIGDVAAEIGARLAGEASAEPAGRRGELCPRLHVEGGNGSYEIVVGRGILDLLPAELAQLGAGPIALVTDWNVGPLHAERVTEALETTGRPVVQVMLPAGETNKDVRPVLEAIDQLLDCGWQRSAPVVALGGGVLGDMAGLVAALTLRGVPFVQLPTTLLAMVDSSVGGKVGVNHRQGKNLLGAFWSPSLVWVDLEFLDTLPDRELRAGLGEVLKTALLGDTELLERLESEPERALARDPDFLAEIVERCCRYKARVVAADATEQHVRRVLNLGHTVGHAIEAAAGYGRILHGEAVAIGLVAAAELAVALGKGPADLPDRIRRACVGLGLPTRAANLPLGALRRALESDKKVAGTGLTWVLLRDPGQPASVQLPLDQAGEWLAVLQGSGVL